MFDHILITLIAFAAGLMDAIIGGGGMILLPALLDRFPRAPLADLLALNKAALLAGTILAAWRYTRHTRLAPVHRKRLPLGLPWAAALAMAASLAGALAISHLSTHTTADLRLLLPLPLLALPLYMLLKKDLGKTHAAHIAKDSPRSALILLALGGSIGFYDGFFGPGTGSIFIFAIVRFLGYDFLHASAWARVLCVATGVAALVYFGWRGHIDWPLAWLLGGANLAGAWLGTHLALRRGTGFVRVFFIVGVSLLVAKMLYEQWGVDIPILTLI